MKQIIPFTLFLFSLLFTRTSAETLDTTLVGGSREAGNMFDLCAKTNVEITSLDINCKNETVYDTSFITIEIYIATAINESYALINNDSSSWTLIHRQNVTCQPEGTLTVLNAFNINTIPALINNGDCRGFYVTLIDGRLAYTNGLSVGSIFASNADLDFKEGIGLTYPFGETYTPRVWNGRIHYNVVTDAPTTATPTTATPTTATPTTATPTYGSDSSSGSDDSSDSASNSIYSALSLMDNVDEKEKKKNVNYHFVIAVSLSQVTYIHFFLVLLVLFSAACCFCVYRYKAPSLSPSAANIVSDDIFI